MKNLILGILVLVSVSLNAQCVKGNWLVGGDAGFNSSKADVTGAESVSTITIDPNLGYFIADNFAVGAAINFKSSSSGGTTSTLFAAGPFVRYYFLNIGESAKLLAQGQYVFGSIKLGDAASTSFSGWKISAGAAWFLNHHIALEGLLGYSSAKSGETGAVATNTFGFEVGFQIELGE